MALAHFTKEYGINDMKVYKLLTDPAGAPATYATGVDVPGIQNMDMSLTMKTQTLRGDNTLLAADSVLEQVKGKVKYAKLGFDVYSAVLSSGNVDSGTTPNQKVTFTVTQNDSPAFHKIEAQSRQVDFVGGDVHIILNKAMPGSIDMGFTEENYQEQSYDYIAVPLLGSAGGTNNVWFQIVANETAVAVT